MYLLIPICQSKTSIPSFPCRMTEIQLQLLETFPDISWFLLTIFSLVCYGLLFELFMNAFGKMRRSQDSAIPPNIITADNSSIHFLQFIQFRAVWGMEHILAASGGEAGYTMKIKRTHTWRTRHTKNRFRWQIQTQDLLL